MSHCSCFYGFTRYHIERKCLWVKAGKVVEHVNVPILVKFLSKDRIKLAVKILSEILQMIFNGEINLYLTESVCPLWSMI